MEHSYRSVTRRRSGLAFAALLLAAGAAGARAQEEAPTATSTVTTEDATVHPERSAADAARSRRAPTPTPTSTSTSTSSATSTPSPAPPPERPSAGEEIVVTATRGPRSIRDVPAAVTVVRRDAIERSPTKTVDELLRIDPSFTLFRRSSSVAADPSSQGLKLRNVGGTGVSRALVLVDGIPANDSFGGWVAWRSMPRLSLQRLEVVPGGGSALYGNYALGGVIQAFSRPIQPLDLDVTAETGSFGSALVAGRATDRRGPLGLSLDGELFRSDGYLVAKACPAASPSEQCRGAIDGATPSRHATLRGRVETEATSALTFDLRGGFFWEDFDGGTAYTTAGVRRYEYAGGGHWAAGAGNLDVTLYGHHGAFTQGRTRAIASGGDPRAAETPSAHQSVPTDDVGASALWRTQPLALAGTHTLSAGTDARLIWGNTYETFLFAATPATGTRLETDAGGQQRLYGAFVEDLWDLTSALGASAALRYDRWENRVGYVSDALQGGTSSHQYFGTHSGGELSPKVGLRYRVVELVALRGAAYRSFRAPTLDELYRSFQVGAVRTLSNPTLTPERMRGGEVGVDLGAGSGPSLRLTGFWNELQDPIVNATIGNNLRQRQNLGAARIQGLQADAAWPFAPRWSANAAYTLAATRVTSAPDPTLVGNQLAQAPKHLATFSLAFDDPRLVTANAQLRYLGRQYEDDRNALPLGDVLLVDLFAAWHATRRVDFYLAVENLLDRTYLVGRAGLDTIGQPRFVHGGVRIRSGG